MKKVIVITGNSFRHQFFLEQIEKHFDVIMAISEVKFSYQNAFKTETGDSFIERHFDSRDENERKYFEHANPKSDQIKVEKGWMKKNAELVQKIIDSDAEAVFLFGSSIINNTILDAFPEKVVNLHLGLSPYYRGSGTNFWPIVDKKPECIGATIHLATAKVDAGGILHQVRANDLHSKDSVHDLGNKTMSGAFRIFPEIALKYLNNEISAQEQKPFEDDKEYRRLNINNESIILAYQYLEEGLIEDYLLNKHQRDHQYPIVTNSEARV